MTTTCLLRCGVLFALLVVAPLARAEEDSGYIWGVRARLKEMNGDIDGAIADYDKAIALDAKDAQPYNARGILKKQKQDFAGAIADFDRAIALKPKDLAIIVGNRGSAKQDSGDLEGALADYDQVIALQPDMAVVYNNRAVIRKTKGDLPGALADYGKAIALEPKDLQFNFNRAVTRQESGDLIGARSDFDQTVMVAPDNPGVYFDRATFRLQITDYDGAIADYGKICELRPESWLGYQCRAIARHAKGDLEAAVADYDLAIGHAGEDIADIQPYREIALRQLKRGTPFATLAKDVAKWPAGWPKNTGLYLIEAITEAELLARAAQGDAHAVPAQKCAAHYFVGMAHLLAGEVKVARTQLEQCVATKLRNSDELILARAELGHLPPNP
jgi:tetratricopeptide (TPR) repeat protein